MALVESFSGIRGIYGKDLTESIACGYAYSHYTFLKNKARKRNVTIVLGTDTRPSGTRLSDTIMGILDCNFIDIGIAPTPVIEFAVRHFNADGGIIITASHNEPYWNGFKFLGKDGAVLSENDMISVINNSKSFKDFHRIQERGIQEKNTEAVKEYTKFIFNIIGKEDIERIKDSNQKIVVDPNGGTGAISKKILEQIGVEVVGVNMSYGVFSRAVEPTEDSLVYLKNVIDGNKADFAAGFDCDADRIEIMLNNGQLLSGHCILALAVDDALSNTKNPKNKFVVVNDVTSNVVRDIVQRYGAKLKEVEVGETNVVREIDNLKAIIGGEGSSGGVIIPPSKCRDGILTLLTVLSVIAKRERNLADIIGEFPEYFTIKKKIEFDAEKHNSIKKFIKDNYSKKGFETRETGGIKGGLKIITGKDSFVWFRASRTEGSVFRIVTDSDSKKDAEKLMEEAVGVFKKADG
ncbi:hypothetical protein HYW20_03055 [Candidatus Woesearchaeota archaeon]|nr:hypothetical protein [Candidatus Woesearchaeota archaeon]